jgi:hypothetical protein
MEYVVAIPSYKRPNILAKKTLATLQKGGVPADRIHVFVANAEEKEAYDSVDKSLYGTMTIGVPGLAAQREFIQRHFPKGQYIVFMDDDITAVKKKVENKLVPVENLVALFEEGLTVMKRNKANIWGIYPAANQMFMSDSISTHLTYIIGAFYGIKNTRKRVYGLKYGDNQEDKERTLRYWKKDGVVIRFNSITITTAYYAPGGMDSPTRKAETAEYTQKLVDEFPDLLSRIYKEKHGIYDLRFKKVGCCRMDVENTTCETLPLRNPEKVAEIGGRLLEELRKINIPKIMASHPKSETRLKEKMERSARIGNVGRTMTLGYGDTRRGYKEFSTNKRFAAAFKLLVEFGNAVGPVGWDYNTITLNKGVLAKKHKDSHNLGRSVLIGLGDYEGGQIRVWDRHDENPVDYETKMQPVMFNGGLQYHETQPFTGERFTIIYYRQKKAGECEGVSMVGAE